MGIISWIIFGALAGWIASLVMKTNAQQGWVANIIIGIIGAFVGGWVASMMGLGTVDGFNIGSIIVAILGAILVIFLYQMLTGRKAV